VTATWSLLKVSGLILVFNLLIFNIAVVTLGHRALALQRLFCRQVLGLCSTALEASTGDHHRFYC
jgi:hypothetical protein